MKGCIPAVVSSTEGSCEEGTSEAEGTTQMPPLLEEREVGPADLLRLHRAKAYASAQPIRGRHRRRVANSGPRALSLRGGEDGLEHDQRDPPPLGAAAVVLVARVVVVDLLPEPLPFLPLGLTGDVAAIAPAGEKADLADGR